MADPISLHSLTIDLARKYAADAAEDTSKLGFTQHARKRMTERGITVTQIIEVLRQGNIVEGPYQDTQGRWTSRFEGYSAGKGLAVVAGYYVKGGVRITVVSTFNVRG